MLDDQRNFDSKTVCILGAMILHILPHPSKLDVKYNGIIEQNKISLDFAEQKFKSQSVKTKPVEADISQSTQSSKYEAKDLAER